MNPFVKKEVRLLLPSWIVVMALSLVAPWLAWQDRDTALAATPLCVFFGMILLAVDGFGREFSLGTFASLMSQPMERHKIWRTKITLLLAASGLIYLAYFLSCEGLLHLSRTVSDPGISPVMLERSFWPTILDGAIAVMLALAGGLWTTLLLRQISAAFWITFLTPLGLLVLLTFFVPAGLQASDFFRPFLYCLGVIYSVAGVGVACRMFNRTQDTAWTGGVIAFSRWRYFEAAMKNAVTRRRRPVRALFKKELQLHSISLFCVGAMLVLHGIILLMRGFYARFHPGSIADDVSEFFWGFWLVLPLVLGCMTVAEERKLGVMESQFCLPVKRRTQFLVKFSPALVAGMFLGGILPLLLETTAGLLGAPDELFKPYSSGSVVAQIGPLFFLWPLLSAGLVLAGIFASSLAKNFLQALSIAILVVVACFFFTFLVAGGGAGDRMGPIRFGEHLWGPLLPLLLWLVTVIIFVPWLSFRNYRYFAETNRLWRRNIFGLVGALVFIFGTSTLVYSRVWEFFEPLEPAHGPAKFSLANSPVLYGGFYTGLKVSLPDGRVWYDYVWSGTKSPPTQWSVLWSHLGGELPDSTGPGFLPGSNWVSTTTPRAVGGWDGKQFYKSFEDVLGVKTDGSLWIPAESHPYLWPGDKMVRYGDETNWQEVVGHNEKYDLLLKTDGTLWYWNNGQLWQQKAWQKNWPTVRKYQPQQVGTDSDWQKIYATLMYTVVKKDGTIWSPVEHESTNGVIMTLATNLNAAFLPSISPPSHNGSVFVNTNGTLWLASGAYPGADNQKLRNFLQVGSDTDWVDVAIDWHRLVALKKDGSLWIWRWDDNQNISGSKIAGIPPTRFGIHSDWVGLTTVWNGTVTLAADGSVWYWPAPGMSDGLLMKAPRQPKCLANIFSMNN